MVLAKNKAKRVVMFFKKNILSYFGTPRTIISYGGSHFCNKYLGLHKKSMELSNIKLLTPRQVVRLKYLTRR